MNTTKMLKGAALLTALVLAGCSTKKEPQGVKSGSLFLNQTGTFSCESASLCGGGVLDQGTGGTAAS